MPRLIVNADDLGLTSGVNRAILEAHQQGIVTSATLMANAPAFDEAVGLLQSLSAYRDRKLGIGCHVVLVDGMPLLPAEKVRSLLDASKMFHRKLWKFALAATTGKLSANEVELEASAQIQKLRQAGIEVSHIDCHKHAHMFPPVLEGVLRAAKATGVRAIRNPFEPPFARPAIVRKKSGLRPLETTILSALYAKRFRERVRDFGLVTTDGSLGVTVTGSLDIENFVAIVRDLPQGAYEFVCHPGYNDADLAAAGTRLLQSRETELAVLSSPEARRQLDAAGVELIHFRKLASPTESKQAVSHPMP